MQLSNFVHDRALLFVGLAFVLFFSSFQLFNSPETWMDEGLIIQSAEGILDTGKASVPIAPGIWEPAWYITTGFPLTLPLAGTFAVFGVSLEAARLVMLAFLLCLFGVFFLYARRAIGGGAAWFGLFLLVFFAPIYGNGRNALGEIPGLLFLVLALLPLIQSGAISRRRALWASVAAGCAVAAKPIFILFLPALLLALVLRWKELELKKVFLVGIAGVIVPLVVWAYTQFDQVTLSQVLAVYANPHEVNFSTAIATNVKRFLTELQPLYFFAVLSVWTLSYGVRRFRREAISLTEEAMFFFSILVFLAYLRTAGYYRYFFPAQVFALLYLPQSLLYLARNYGRSIVRVVLIGLFGLILFQAYETAFRSWVAVHYDSTRTQELEKYFSNLSLSEEIFIYQAPEIVSFVGKHRFYQYVEILPTVRATGKNYQQLVLSGSAQLVITPSELFQANKDGIFSHYLVSEKIENYVILMPKDRG
jgi:hypothetical protein